MDAPKEPQVSSPGLLAPDTLTPSPGPVVLQNADDVVATLTPLRRWTILFVVCWMALPMTFMSTSIMTVTPEIAATLGTQPTSITTANAGVFVAMALSALLWLPIATILGRRTAYLVATVVLGLCSIGCALSPNLACLTTLWVVSGTTGPFFLTAGQTILSDIFEPAVRGTAVGFFLGSCVSAQSIAPMIGSIIATYTSWRVIFAVQGAMTFLGLVLSFIFVPRRSQLALPEKQPAPHREKMTLRVVARAFNPMAVFRQWRYPSIILANFSCGLLAVNQYGLLSTVRHIINPRFGLTSPLYGGLFYLAPGVGFLAGSLVGGSVSDRFVRRYVRKRNGARLPEDRLTSNLLWSVGVLPMGTLIYGWSVDRKLGGLGVPISFAFIQGFGLMAAFSVLNTYAAEVHPEFKMAVLSGKYVVQYSFGAVSVGGMVPMIDAIGTGWSFTICAVAALIGGSFVLVITQLFVRPAPGKPLAKPSLHSGKIPSPETNVESPERAIG